MGSGPGQTGGHMGATSANTRGALGRPRSDLSGCKRVVGPAVAAMIMGRAHWLRDNGYLRWRGWARNADVLPAMVGDVDRPVVWLLTGPDDQVLGMTTLSLTPDLGWTEQERAEPATFLQSTPHPPRNRSGAGPVGVPGSSCRRARERVFHRCGQGWG